MAKQIVDKSSIIIPQGTMEDFKRPDHTDFATSSELKQQEWSGVRHNSMAETMEVWLLGELKKSITPEQLGQNLHALDEAVAEVFGLDEVRPYDATLIAYKHKQNMKGNK